jgi:hypothetical protein
MAAELSQGLVGEVELLEGEPVSADNKKFLYPIGLTGYRRLSGL